MLHKHEGISGTSICILLGVQCAGHAAGRVPAADGGDAVVQPDSVLARVDLAVPGRAARAVRHDVPLAARRLRATAEGGHRNRLL